MSNNVQKGKDISVLVEQAFPSCILVSFQQGERTFRGVLLDESSQTVIRSSPSGVLGKADTTASLGLTTARATTCQSNQHNSSTRRVTTRSSTMILRDGKGDGSGSITPVDKIPGIVDCLHQPQRNIAPTTQLSNPSSFATCPTQNQKQFVKRKQLLPQHNIKGNVTSLKRKRDCKPIQCDESFFKSPKAINKEDTNTSNSLSPKKSKNSKEMELGKLSAESSLSIQRSPQSPIFPVLKLKRTSEKDNSYVAVTAFSSQSSQLKEVHGVEKSEPISDETAEKELSDVHDTRIHQHNTRFKARQGAENCQSSLGSEINLDKTNQPANVQSENAFKSIQVSSAISMKYELNGSNSKHSTTAISQRGSKTESLLHAPKKIYNSENMKVGDIVWGKVHGHPWWPGRVLHISCNTSESDGGYQNIVKVSWYGSTTTSNISCGSLLMFENNFKHLYKRKKLGAYRLAVRQAQQDLEICMNETEVLPA